MATEQEPSPNLEYVTTEELIKELSHRSLGLALAMCPKSGHFPASWSIALHGNSLVRQGLGRLILAQLNTDLKDMLHES